MTDEEVLGKVVEEEMNSRDKDTEEDKKEKRAELEE